MYDLVICPMDDRVLAKVGRKVYVSPLQNNTYVVFSDWVDDQTEWPVVGQVPSLEAWRADPGGFGPTCAVARIEANGENYTVGGNCLAILGYARDRGVEPEWLQSFTDRNKARAAADVEI